MSRVNSNLKIERINKDNYLEFSKVIEWRRLGEKAEKINYERYNEYTTKAFFEKYNIFNTDFYYLLGAKFDSKFVGYISTSMIPKPDNRLGVYFVDELWVASEYRNKGIAEELMKEVFNKSIELGMWRVRLYVNVDNTIGRSFYKKLGFVEDGEAMFCQKNI